jgi:hypothetical protein
MQDTSTNGAGQAAEDVAGRGDQHGVAGLGCAWHYGLAPFDAGGTLTLQSPTIHQLSL